MKLTHGVDFINIFCEHFALIFCVKNYKGVFWVWNFMAPKYEPKSARKMWTKLTIGVFFQLVFISFRQFNSSIIKINYKTMIQYKGSICTYFKLFWFKKIFVKTLFCNNRVGLALFTRGKALIHRLKPTKCVHITVFSNNL